MSVFQRIILLVFLFLYGAIVHAQINVSTNLVQPTVEMVWEVHSYIPPFYKGKALYPIGGEVTVLAMPPSAMGDPNVLSYIWKRDGEVQGSLSGLGKRSFTFAGSTFGDVPLIVVEVSDGGTKKATGVVRIQQTNPFIRFYENRPLGGVALEHALPRSLTTGQSDFTIEAYPYFFSADTRGDTALTYTWAVNGQKIAGATGPSVVVQNNEPQSMQVQLSVNHASEILQRTSDSFVISFE